MRKLRFRFWFRKVWKWWFDDDYHLELIREKRKAIRFKRAKKLADKKHEADAKTYYVILGPGDRYFVYNSNEMLVAKKRGIFKQSMTIHDIYSAASYIATSTPDLKKS